MKMNLGLPIFKNIRQNYANYRQNTTQHAVKKRAAQKFEPPLLKKVRRISGCVMLLFLIFLNGYNGFAHHSRLWGSFVQV